MWRCMLIGYFRGSTSKWFGNNISADVSSATSNQSAVVTTNSDPTTLVSASAPIPYLTSLAGG